MQSKYFGEFLAYAVLLIHMTSPSWCLSLEGVTTEGGGQFAQLHQPTRFLCSYTLDEGQTLQKLGWFREGVPVMTWTLPDTPVASAEYRGRLNFTGEDGALHINKVEVTDAGPFTCTVQSDDGKQKSSDPFYVAVADVPSFGFSMSGNVADCQLHFSFTAPPIYPKPQPLCGVWSTDTLYTGTAADWQAVPYYNGSVAYSIVDTTFPVRGMPLQAGIRCEMSFPPTNGSPEDDRIIAWQNTAYYPQVSERGCPALEVGDNIQVSYTNHRTTCRGELALQDPTKQLVAMVSCVSGTKSSLRGGGMGSLSLQCLRMQWEPVGGVSWDEFADMECYDDDGAGGSSSLGSSDPEDPGTSTADGEAAVVTEVTAGTGRLLSHGAVPLLMLYGIVVYFSGVV